jgi:two-component system sensor histidine kinase GlrK
MQQVLVAIALPWCSRPAWAISSPVQATGAGHRRPGYGQPINIGGPSDVRGVSQQLEWLRLRLTELDADKARFLRHVSHELKTPLAALREGVALLQDGVTGKLNISQHEVVRILHQNTLALQGQIEALLRFNAAAFEARQLHRRKTDLLALLHAQVEAQRLQWQGRRLTVQVRGEPMSLPVDPESWARHSAICCPTPSELSPEGGTVLVQLSAPPEAVCIDIMDEGPGVAQADQQRVFEPFYRGERQPQDAVRGTGIGLSIVQEYIAAHGGRVELLSDSGGGHFRVELPHAP